MKKTVVLTIVLFGVVASGHSVATHGDPHEREMLYLSGSSGIPPDAALPGCDLATALGSGGVLFCSIPQGSTVHLEVADGAIWPTVSIVTCILNPAPASHGMLFSLTNGGTFILPPGCLTHADDDPGTTRVGVFPQIPPGGPGATVGTVTLVH